MKRSLPAALASAALLFSLLASAPSPVTAAGIHVLSAPTITDLSPGTLLDGDGVSIVAGGFPAGEPVHLQLCPTGDPTDPWPAATSPYCRGLGDAETYADESGVVMVTARLPRLLFDQGSTGGVSVTPSTDLLDGDAVLVEAWGLPSPGNAIDCAGGCWITAHAFVEQTSDGYVSYGPIDFDDSVLPPQLEYLIAQGAIEGPNEPTPDIFWTSQALNAPLFEVSAQPDGTILQPVDVLRFMEITDWNAQPRTVDCADPALGLPTSQIACAMVVYIHDASDESVEWGSDQYIGIYVQELSFRPGELITEIAPASVAYLYPNRTVLVRGTVTCGGAAPVRVHLSGMVWQPSRDPDRRPPSVATFDTDVLSCHGTTSWQAIAYPISGTLRKGGTNLDVTASSPGLPDLELESEVWLQALKR